VHVDNSRATGQPAAETTLQTGETIEAELLE